jgi:hypothetical protein
MFRHIAHTAISLPLAAIGSLLLFAGVNPAQAQENAHYVAAVPFDFDIEDAVFPAGIYQLTPLSQHALRLEVVGGTRAAYVLVFSTEDAIGTRTGELRFTQYGSRYFLREFSAPEQGHGWHAVSRCVRSADEKRVAKEWMARAHAPRGVDVAVNSADQH